MCHESYFRAKGKEVGGGIWILSGLISLHDSDVAPLLCFISAEWKYLQLKQPRFHLVWKIRLFHFSPDYPKMHQMIWILMLLWAPGGFRGTNPTLSRKKKKKSPWRQSYLTTSLSTERILMFLFFPLLPITVIRPLDLCVLHKSKDFIWYPCSWYWISNLGEWINDLAVAENPLKKY